VEQFRGIAGDAGVVCAEHDHGVGGCGRVSEVQVLEDGAGALEGFGRHRHQCALAAESVRVDWGRRLSAKTLGQQPDSVGSALFFRLPDSAEDHRVRLFFRLTLSRPVRMRGSEQLRVMRRAGHAVSAPYRRSSWRPSCCGSAELRHEAPVLFHGCATYSQPPFTYICLVRATSGQLSARRVSAKVQLQRPSAPPWRQRPGSLDGIAGTRHVSRPQVG
jgi:hypothetical protein